LIAGKRRQTTGVSMARIAVRWLMLLLMLLVLLPAVAGAAEHRPGEEELFNDAQMLYRSGAYDEALARFRSFILRFYDSDLTNDAYLTIARILQHQGQCDDALLYLKRIPQAQQTPASQLMQGVCQVETDHLADGLQQLRGLFDAGLEGEDASLFYTTLFHAERDNNRLVPAIAFAWRALRTPGDHGPLLAEVHELLEQRLSEAEVAEVRFLFADSAIGQDATLQLARRALAHKDEASARALLQQLLASSVAFPYHADADRLLARLSGEVNVERDAVGVLLPLSGRYAAFGELVQRGMELALKLHNESHSPVRFLYRDSAADPEVSLRQFGTLVNEERVMAIAGPLTATAAEAVVDRATQERVPLLTLSQKPGLPETSPYVFRDSLTVTLQARALARYAVQEQGLRSFGILYPDNRTGKDFATQFARAVAAEGGLVTAMESYGEKDTDFRRPVRRLIGLDPNAREQRPPKLTPEEELEDLFVPEELKFPAAPFEALFIPDYAERIGLIAPQLTFYGLDNTQLLGINGWNSRDLVRLAGRYVDRAVFVDGFFRYSSYPFVKEFVDLYYKTYKEEPSILEAQAFDVANILLSLLDRPELRDREDLRDALAALRNYPGVTGATSFNAQGEAEKILFLLQVQKGKIVQIN